MPDPSPQPKPQYRFENDLSGRMFCWLIEAGRIDWRGLMEEVLREQAGGAEAVERLAKALKHAVGEPGKLAAAGWQPQFQRGPGPAAQPLAPAYSIWFRPSPSKKVKFKEVAEALLTFAGWHSSPG
jgi:hypothetical protein